MFHIAMNVLTIVIVLTDTIVFSCSREANGIQCAEQEQKSVDKLVLSLQCECYEAKIEAAKMLGKLGVKAKAAIPDLINTLDSPEEELAEEIEIALGKIGIAAIQLVLDTIESKKASPKVKKRCLLSFSKMSRKAFNNGMPRLLKLVETQDKLAKNQILEIVGNRAADVSDEIFQAVLSLIQGILHEKGSPFETRLLAVETIQEFSRRAEPAIPILVLLCGNEFRQGSAELAKAAACSLGRIGPAAIPGIISIIMNPGTPTEARNYCIRVIWTIENSSAKGTARSAVPALNSLLYDEEPNVRSVAAEVLAKLCNAENVDISDLVHCALNGTYADKLDCARALKRVDPSNPVSIPVLIELARKSNEPERSIAIGELLAIDTRYKMTRWIPTLLGGFEDLNTDVRIAILNLVSDLGPAGKDGLPILKRCAKSSDPKIAKAATNAIKKISSNSEMKK